MPFALSLPTALLSQFQSSSKSLWPFLYVLSSDRDAQSYTSLEQSSAGNSDQGQDPGQETFHDIAAFEKVMAATLPPFAMWGNWGTEQ